jgi:hypothetical protein
MISDQTVKVIQSSVKCVSSYPQLVWSLQRIRHKDETEICSHKSKFASVEGKHVLMLNAGGSESTF